MPIVCSTIFCFSSLIFNTVSLIFNMVSKHMARSIPFVLGKHFHIVETTHTWRLWLKSEHIEESGVFFIFLLSWSADTPCPKEKCVTNPLMHPTWRKSVSLTHLVWSKSATHLGWRKRVSLTPLTHLIQIRSASVMHLVLRKRVLVTHFVQRKTVLATLHLHAFWMMHPFDTLCYLFKENH